mgnify:CR=1 FL=1
MVKNIADAQEIVQYCPVIQLVEGNVVIILQVAQVGRELTQVLVLDGNIMLTERDEFIYDEMITHVPMAVHPCITRVLVIGVGDGGVVRELTRYGQIERIDLVEMDEMVAEACRQYLPENACRLDDDRVHIYYENALKTKIARTHHLR